MNIWIQTLESPISLSCPKRNIRLERFLYSFFFQRRHKISLQFLLPKISLQFLLPKKTQKHRHLNFSVSHYLSSFQTFTLISTFDLAPVHSTQTMTNQVLSIAHNGAIPHFVLVPFMAQGHTIPLVDMATLLAEHGAFISFITTPVNAARIKNIIDRVKASGLPIQFIELNFPCIQCGLPQGCENLDLVTSPDLYKPFFEAMTFFQEPLELYLKDVKPSPTCIISDNIHWWTVDTARVFNIPRLTFHGPSCFFILSSHNIQQNKVYDTVTDENEPFVVPDLPREIIVTKAQAPGWFDMPGWEKIRENILQAEAASEGVVVNSFNELEPEYFKCYEETIGKKVWPIGPLSLYNKDLSSKVTRGNKASIDEHQVLNWLDSFEPSSVLLVSFGSLVKNRPSQLIELGCGLEASNRPFIWVIKEAERCEELEKWMSEGFKERTKERSLIIIGWAPQVVILSHPSIGGFMTHCGWNSTLEAISAGVPMITWPHFADQYLNEKLVVEVLKLGVAVGAKIPFYHLKEGEVTVKKENVEKAVVSLMDGGEEGEERRVKAREFGEKARKAMEEGGSSYENLSLLMQFVMDGTCKNGLLKEC